MNRRVLIVEDHDMNRELLHTILDADYEILDAANGVEAMKILQTEYDTLSAVILDLAMPEMDGFEVLDAMHCEKELAQIPVIVATVSGERESERKALRAGAIDYITKPYDPDVLKNRLHNTIELREQAAIVNATRRDELTGLYSRTAFFDHARKLIHSHESGFYVMSCYDIDHFKLINDQYGNNKGDEVLKGIAAIFLEGFSQARGIVSRIMADNFAILYPRSFMDSPEIEEIRRKASVLDGSIIPLTFSVGRYFVDDITMEPSAMYDRAMIAKECVKGRYDEHIAVYDEDMRNRIISEREIIGEMKQALVEKQFEVWYQPQFNHMSGLMIGAEALVRWRHPMKGLISPAQFIPIFERNGFIYEIDQYVWEQVCIFLRSMLDSGKQMVPVSVNVSRYDFFRSDIIEVLSGFIQKYNIPADMLRLEITESAFATSSEQIIYVVKQLKEIGFIIEIDDFGSGYSSLNILKDVPADVIKLDMRFLEGEENTDKGGNILESVVRMARWISMTVIAEGVERAEQADFLKSIGCYYIQGYLYTKPLPREEFQKAIQVEGYAERMSSIEMVETYDSETFWNPESMATLIFNSFVGGACIFEYWNDRIEIIRANEKYVRILCGEYNKHTDPLSLKWEKYLTPSSRRGSLKAMQEAIKTGAEITDEMELDGFRTPGKSVYLRATMRVIANTGDRYLFYCILEDLTEQKKAEKSERRLAAQLRVIMEGMDGGVSAIIHHQDGSADLVFANDRFFELRGYTREQYSGEVEHVFDVVHPDDVDRLKEKSRFINETKAPYVITYRIIRRDGTIRWIRNKVSITMLEGYDQPLQIAISDDVTTEHEAIIKERETDQFLQMILRSVGSGITATVLEHNQVEYLFANDQYYRMLGYTKEQYHAEISDPYTTIHPDDRDRIARLVKQICKEDLPAQAEYRVICRDQSVRTFRMVSVNTRMEQYENVVQLSVYADVTDEKKEEEFTERTTGEPSLWRRYL